MWVAQTIQNDSDNNIFQNCKKQKSNKYMFEENKAENPNDEWSYIILTSITTQGTYP